MARRDIIVVGASAGGVEALSHLARAFPPDFAGSVFMVLHVPPNSNSVLPVILARAGRLPTAHAVDGEPVRPGHIYVAPPNCHMLLRGGTVRLSNGPKENSSRPAVDALFRTAAQAYGARVVAVVLSGNLDDGTAGLVAVKRRGGVAIVQDPTEALFSGMPRSAVENAAPAFVLPLADIPAKLIELAATDAPEDLDPMPDDALDPAFGLTHPLVPTPGATSQNPSAFTCPECHGSLWEVQDGELVRFQCRVGHRYSADTLVAEQVVALEAALWTALRALEESAHLSNRLAARAEERGQQAIMERFAEQAVEMEQRAGVVRRALQQAPGSTAIGPDDGVGRSPLAGAGASSASGNGRGENGRGGNGHAGNVAASGASVANTGLT